MWEDPIITETRKIRREIEVECRDNFEEMVTMAIEIQQRYRDRVVSKPSQSKQERAPAAINRV